MKPSAVAISPVATTSKLSWIQNSEDMVGQPSYRETHKLGSHSAEFEWANTLLWSMRCAVQDTLMNPNNQMRTFLQPTKVNVTS